MKKMGIFFIVIFLLQLQMATAEENIAVNFNYNGKKHVIHGKRINRFSYLFNEGAKKKITVTTLEWAPYIGMNICRQGWVQQLTIALLSSQGDEITSKFYPWARTIYAAEHGTVDILYPEYYIEPSAPSDVIKGTKRVEHLAVSKKIPGGPIAFMQRKGDPYSFDGTFNNLKDEKIGVVSGYQNTPEFDALMDQGFFSISKAVDDIMNAHKLYSKRINLIIGDPAVILFSVKNSTLRPDMQEKIINGIEIVKPIIKYNYLYYAISKKRSHWQKTLEMVNKTITEFETSGEMFRIINETNQACGFRMETLDSF